MTKIAIHQPLFIPWLGYFDKIFKADIFVVLDHVQYTRGSWINRNRIKISDNEHLLTVPVIKKGLDMSINSTAIDHSNDLWIRKHLKAIRIAYQKTRYYPEIYPVLENFYNNSGTFISEFDYELITWFCKYLGIETKIVKSSDLHASGVKTELCLDICQKCNADVYIIGMGGNNVYLDHELLVRNNVAVESQNFEHPVYTQTGKGFIAGLSIIDLVFNHGNKSLEIIQNGK